MKHAILVLLVVTAFINLAYAQDITVVTEDWAPYNYMEHGEVVGLSTEVVRATLQEANLKGKITMYPWARAYKMALEQKNVLIYTIVRTVEREDLFKWVGPIAPTGREILYKLKSRTDITIQTLDDAKKYKIGVWRDDVTHHFLLNKGFQEQKHLSVVPDNKQNIEMLFRGRIDLVAESEVSLPIRMKALGLSMNQVEAVFTILEGEEEFYMAFSKQTSDELVERAAAAFERIKTNGRLEAIWQKYLKMAE